MSAAAASTPRLLTPGCRIQGATYAGICTAKTGELYALLLVNSKPGKRLPWQAAMDWAKSLDADLPSRPEAALLFQHLQPQLDPRWHRTNETASFDASSAWLCNFLTGHHFYSHKSLEGSAVAVRRLVLQSFSALADLANAIEVRP